MTDTPALISSLRCLHHLHGYDDEGVCHASEAEAEAYDIEVAKVIYQIQQTESTLSKILKKVGGISYFDNQERNEKDFWALIIAYWYEKAATEKRASEPLVKNLPSLYSSPWMRASTYTEKVQKRLRHEAQRSPPKIFLPIPNKIELGGCARSDSLIAPAIN